MEQESMKGKARFRVDLHTHTWYSADAVSSPKALVEAARAAGLDRIAVTDHGSIEGALEAQALDRERVIIGEEIRCRCGTDVIGLFLREWIAPGQSIETTAKLIREQGGVVYAPHPYAYLRSPRRRGDRVLAVADVVEVFNARAFMAGWNRRAALASALRGLACAASSDAHLLWEIGRAYTDLPSFQDAPSFLLSLREGRPRAVQTGSPFLHVLGMVMHGARTVMGRGHGQPPPGQSRRRGIALGLERPSTIGSDREAREIRVPWNPRSPNCGDGSGSPARPGQHSADRI
jgi:hypothetical protein